MAPGLVLHQFLHSHYNEKARWALDWKGLPHRRVCHLPGPHAPRIRRLAGQTTVPVLVDDGQVVPGSARILEHLEARSPDPPLLPDDPAARERALSIQRRFDDEVGPAVRTALFSAMIHEPDYIVAMFAAREPGWKRRLYRGVFPVAKGMMARSFGLHDPGVVERAFETTRQALDFVAKESEATGYLVGDDFTIADLTAASLLAITFESDHPDMRRPRPVPAAVAAFVAGWQEHPGVRWVGEQYRMHRPGSQELR